MQRLDDAHSQPSQPHPVQIPEDKLEELFWMLEQRDIDLAEFAGKVSAYPDIRKRILQAANSAATGRSTDITDPIHAAAYLGSRRLFQIVTSMTSPGPSSTMRTDAA